MFKGIASGCCVLILEAKLCAGGLEQRLFSSQWLFCSWKCDPITLLAKQREYCSTDVFIFVTSFKACSGSHSSEAKRVFSIVKCRQSPQLRESCPGSFWITLIFFRFPEAVSLFSFSFIFSNSFRYFWCSTLRLRDGTVQAAQP